jgi:hypothetical protein
VNKRAASWVPRSEGSSRRLTSYNFFFLLRLKSRRYDQSSTYKSDLFFYTRQTNPFFFPPSCTRARAARNQLKWHVALTHACMHILIQQAIYLFSSTSYTYHACMGLVFFFLSSLISQNKHTLAFLYECIFNPSKQISIHYFQSIEGCMYVGPNSVGRCVIQTSLTVSEDMDL